MTAPLPTVTCVIPTIDRPGFLGRAIRYWTRQTWPARELVIVDDSARPDAAAAAFCADAADATYLHVPPTPQGEKLNLGIAHGHGTVVHKWDDDDIYAPEFLAHAVAALDAAPDGPDGRFVVWDCYLLLLAWCGEVRFTGHGHKAGMGMVFDRSVWDAGGFRPIPHSTDSWFQHDHPQWTPVCGHAADIVAVRHRANTWRTFWDVDVDAYVEAECPHWHEPLAALVPDPDDLAFYRSLAVGPSGTSG